ncbi:MAG: methionyl-tRNA formyltransferase, partial [Chloroflexota bacterium]|nr:methionyl-tRNA formyltransferase [Chloroflexota bacterium]
MTARLVYMGTPEFACPALEMLASRTDVEIGLVVTQPDRESGRGRKMRATPVAHVAERIGLPVYRVESLRTSEARQPIVAVEPDLIVVAAFGLILGSSMLRLPPRG